MANATILPLGERDVMVIAPAKVLEGDRFIVAGKEWWFTSIDAARDFCRACCFTWTIVSES